MSLMPYVLPALAALPAYTFNFVNGHPLEPLFINNTLAAVVEDSTCEPNSDPGQRYPVPGASTTLFFTDFGRQLQANWASNFFRKAISNVKRIVEVSGGVEPIESGKYVLKNYGLEIKILDGQRYSELKETMSNQVLLDALRGLNQYFIEKRGGYYYEAVFDVRVPKDGGNGENIVGHAFFRLQKTSNCLDLKSFDLVDVDSEDVRSEEVD